MQIDDNFNNPNQFLPDNGIFIFHLEAVRDGKFQNARILLSFMIFVDFVISGLYFSIMVEEKNMLVK